MKTVRSSCATMVWRALYLESILQPWFCQMLSVKAKITLMPQGTIVKTHHRALVIQHLKTLVVFLRAKLKGHSQSLVKRQVRRASPRRRRKKICVHVLLRPKMHAETWKENWQVTSWRDGTVHQRSFYSRRTMDLVSTFGQLVASLRNCLVWCERMPQLLWTDNLFSQASHASRFRPQKIQLSNGRASLSPQTINWRSFSKLLEHRTSRIKVLLPT